MHFFVFFVALLLQRYLMGAAKVYKEFWVKVSGVMVLGSSAIVGQRQDEGHLMHMLVTHDPMTERHGV